MFILSYSYVSIILPFGAAGDFFMGLRTFKPASHRPRIFEEVPTYHCSKKDEPSIQKHFNKRGGELRFAYGKVIWFDKVKIVLKTQ